MCDPLSLGALAIGAAGTAANSIGQANAAKKQESEYNSWAAMQKKNREQENARQQGLREQATAAQQQGVEDISLVNQSKLQDAEQARLEAVLAGEDANAAPGPNTPVAPADATATPYGGDVYQNDFGTQLADAMASAKKRIGALATVQSFGDSFGGLGTVNPINQATAGAGIDEANAKREGSLAAYQTEQAVDPTQITYSNPVADIASSFLGAGMQGLGQGVANGGGISSIFKGTLAPKVKAPLPGTGFGLFS
jgi:hypothetical protein